MEPPIDEVVKAVQVPNIHRSILLVLDINGTLVRRLGPGEIQAAPRASGKNPPGLVPSKKEKKKPLAREIIQGKSFTYQVRPGAKEFLRRCFEHFQVAVWSSTTYSNVHPLIESLFTYEQQRQLIFRWDRDRTQLDPDFRSDPAVKDFDTIKPISEIANCPTFLRRWNSRNILLIDDSPRKTRFNDDKNVQIIPEYLNNDETFSFDEFFQLLVSKAEKLLNDV